MSFSADPLAAALPAEADSRTHRARERLAWWAALALILVWGANFSVQKAVFEALSPGGFLFVRYLIMPVAAALLLCSRHGPRWPRLPRADLVALLKLGIERLTRAQVAGVAVACVGVLVFLSDKLLGGQWRASGGDLVLLVAASFFSYYTVAAKPLIERHGGVTVMTYATLMGSAPVLLVSLPAGLQVDWVAVSPLIWAGMLWAVLVSAFLGWLVWGWINAVRGVARTAPLLYLMPPVAGLVAWFTTGEHYTAVKLAGAALALAGVALAQFASRVRRDEVLESSVTVID